MKSGIELIEIERKEQIEKHGRSIENDAKFNSSNELPNTAALLINGGEWASFEESDMEMMPDGWDENIWRKMLLKTYPERLIIAGALIAAELDRLNFVNAE